MLVYVLVFLTATSTISGQNEDVHVDSVNNSDSLTIMPEMKKVISDSWFGEDKILHFSAGFAIPGLTYHFYVCRLDGDEQRGKVYAVSLTALLAFGKEFYDKKKKGHFSWKDLAWGGLGLAVGYFVLIN
ncbi:MAG: hypothetical protein OEV79_11090 [candidate division WOR-3 bacterium]|nr:hypothetical protein [candidate division WOR-3 bacterium]